MKELRQVALAVAINCATSKNEYEAFMDVSIKEDMNRRISGKSGQGIVCRSAATTSHYSSCRADGAHDIT